MWNRRFGRPYGSSKKEGNSWEWLVTGDCKRVGMVGRIIESRPEKRSRGGEVCRHIMIPPWRSQRAMARLGPMPAALEEFFLHFSPEPSNHIMVLLLPEILKQGDMSIRTFSISYLRCFSVDTWERIAAPFVRILPQRMTELRVQYCHLPLDVVPILCEILRAVPNLKRLAFGHCNDGHPGTLASLSDLEMLGELAANRLEYVSLVRAHFGDEGIRRILSGMARRQGACSLTTLKLQKVGMASESVPDLVSFLNHARSIRTLDLSSNQLGDAGGLLLATYIRENPTGVLENLYLSRVRVGDAALATLAEAVQTNTRLKEIVVSSLQLGPAGIQAFLQVLVHNTSVQRLSLSPYYFNFDETKWQFDRAAFLKNTTVTQLYLPRVPAHLGRTLDYVCARNAMHGKVLGTLSGPVSLSCHLIAHVVKHQEGISILHYLLRSRLVLPKVLQ